jgi:outer membrane protein OmpA-like peptidoglycan-associated protein
VTQHRLLRSLPLACSLCCFAFSSAGAQAFPGFGGVEARIGVTFPNDAEAAPAFAGEVDLGYVLRPSLRTLVGVTRFIADIDREPGGDEGSYRATGFFVGARYDLLHASSIAPYVRGEIVLQRVTADAFDPDVGALLEGSYAGFAAALGARYRLDSRGRLGATAEVRRLFINNVGTTSMDVGIRFQPRGIRSYFRDLPDIRPRPAEPAIPAAAPGTDAPTTPPPAAAPLSDVERAAEAARRVEARRAEEAAARARAEDARRLRALAAEGMLRQGLQRATVSMPSLATFAENEREFSVTIGGFAFASGAASLTPGARDQLRVLATVLAGYPGHIVIVEGHADAAGNRDANQVLSAGRATAVRAALIAEGVDPLWVAARGMGIDHPIASNATAAGRAANRRVVVRVSRDHCATLPVSSTEGMLVCAR